MTIYHMEQRVPERGVVRGVEGVLPRQPAQSLAGTISSEGAGSSSRRESVDMASCTRGEDGGATLRQWMSRSSYWNAMVRAVRS